MKFEHARIYRRWNDGKQREREDSSRRNSAASLFGSIDEHRTERQEGEDELEKVAGRLRESALTLS